MTYFINKERGGGRVEKEARDKVIKRGRGNRG